MAAITGTAPTNIPGQVTDPGTPFKQITSGTETIRIYDNGVMYSVDSKTGMQFWSVPNATTGITEQITQFANGQIIVEQLDASNVMIGGPSFYTGTGQLINPASDTTTLTYNDYINIDKTLNQSYGNNLFGSASYDSFNTYFSN
ncbi:MAG: hypothetical protein PHG89_06020 [Gallionella sp.]|nr:hypothetical protein [Gallionella sp.]